MSNHYSIDLMTDEDGWWPGLCNCGANLGTFPTAEDACDALMDHAYAAGVAADVTEGLPPDLVRAFRDPTIIIDRDHEIVLADGRSLFEHLREWRDAPSNTASASFPATSLGKDAITQSYGGSSPASKPDVSERGSRLPDRDGASTRGPDPSAMPRSETSDPATTTVEFEMLMDTGDIRAIRDYIGHECSDPDCPYCPRFRALIAGGVVSLSSELSYEASNQESERP